MTMKEALLTASLALFFGMSPGTAAPSDPAPPPPPPEQPNRPPGSGPGPDRDHRRPPGPDHDHHQMGQMGHFPREGGDHGDAFRKLSEEDRQKVRLAFEKAWNKPEVIAAREQLMKANDQYREALHAAIQEADPEVPKILERSKGDGGSPGNRPRPNLPPMPDPADPEFAHKAVQRLASELQGGGMQPGGMQPPMPDHGDRRDGEHRDRRDGEHRDPSPMMRLHERVMQSPPVRDALKELEQSDPGHRMEAWGHLREAYQKTARAEIARLREGQRLESPPGPPPSKPPGPPPDAPVKPESPPAPESKP